MNVKKIAILGASGFIGQNLLNSIADSEGVSLRDRDWRIAFSTARVVINLVGKAHDHKRTAAEQDYYFANVELAKQVFNTFLESKAELLIHISSLAAVEEFEASTPLLESTTCHPQSWYGQSKRQAEEWLLAQTLPENKKLIIIRSPMVHGAGDKGNLGLLYKLISKGIPYPLASFDNKRSFISIDNFCFFIEQIIAHYTQLSSGIYHVADDESVATKEIIDIIKELTGKRGSNLALPKFLVKGIAKVGDVLPIPLNTMRLKKMTSDLLVSNEKIKSALHIDKLPLSSREGLVITIKSFQQ